MSDMTAQLGELTRTPIVLAEDADSRVERIDSSPAPLLRKTYKSKPRLAWRSLFRRARAEREFTNLRALDAAGVPCVHAICWSEHRRAGCVVASSIVTEFVAGAVDLRSHLRAGPPRHERRRLAADYGALLRALHAAGFRSTTMSLRNVLLEPGTGRLVLCDQPHLFRTDRKRLARDGVRIDLYDAFFSPNRRRDWSATERLRGVLAYCGGDRAAARALWRWQGGSRHKQQGWRREWCRLGAALFARRLPRAGS